MISKIKDIRQKLKVAAGILNKKVYTGPWTVQIDLTNRCNNNCIACWCRSPLLKDREMDEETKKKMLSREVAMKLIDDLDRLGVREIYLTGGGEPLMHPNALEIMRYIKKKNIKLDMSTNFTMVNENVAKEFVDMGLDHMNISIWAGTAKTYSLLHPNKTEKTFKRIEKVLNFIQKLKKKKGKSKPKIGMYNVILNLNYHEVEKMLEFAFRTRLNEIDFVPVDTIPGRTDVLKLNKKQREELARRFRNLWNLFPVFERKYNHTLEFRNYEQFLRRIENEDAEEANYDTNIIDSIPCYAGWTFARILANGDVNSCLKSFRIPTGNIYNESFEKIWLNEKQALFREKTLNCRKSDPYFRQMGNDLNGDQGCYKCCDNLGLNLLVHGKLSKLKSYQKFLIKILRFL
jgi:MoaA/NifB/PqqE/SkfB family radical SAM enzyme